MLQYKFKNALQNYVTMTSFYSKHYNLILYCMLNATPIYIYVLIFNLFLTSLDVFSVEYSHALFTQEKVGRIPPPCS